MREEKCLAHCSAADSVLGCFSVLEVRKRSIKIVPVYQIMGGKKIPSHLEASVHPPLDKEKATRGTAGLFNHAQNPPLKSARSSALQCLQPF